MKAESPQSRFAGFLAKYDPAVAAVGKKAIAKLRKLLPGAVELVYDNYNALVVAFGPNERASEALMSIALYPRWVNVFFADGVALADPKGLLQGSGKHVRHIALSDATDLDKPEVRALVTQVVKRSASPLPKKSRGTMVIKSISAKQRPRRPSAKS